MDTEKRGTCRSHTESLVSKNSGGPLKKPSFLLWGHLAPRDKITRAGGCLMITIHRNFDYKDVNACISLKLMATGSSLKFKPLRRIYKQLLNQFIIFLITFPLSSIKSPCNSEVYSTFRKPSSSHHQKNKEGTSNLRK